MGGAGVQRALTGSGTALSKAFVVMTRPFVLGGFALYAVSAVLWLLILARVEVSAAYPFVGLGFVLTMLGGAWVLGEELSWVRVAGTALVVVGVVLVSRS
jgi:drug/metabolite transporter (DMT)-like permease